MMRGYTLHSAIWQGGLVVRDVDLESKGYGFKSLVGSNVIALGEAV